MELHCDYTMPVWRCKHIYLNFLNISQAIQEFKVLSFYWVTNKFISHIVFGLNIYQEI